ncbi:single-strand DNA-binding protein [Isoptericola jiangsuensis]|uniref:Single-stranded DNA-binding protein n=1 Tax=Isoptericola jiangsuensis TaxID=548579 RepID=A0A2A9EWU5_9MICO|nr:single-stranded DNA-binding protein [Isoptericola jiangsuensis]PFG42649.1 single-strand DNA-binding protein [Isoptericola jiangsuensis]
MSEASVTVTGYVGTTPELHLSANQVPWTSFRVASTRRVRDGRTGEWRDGATTWFTVKAFRGAARTVSESLVQGQPVVVVGRLSAEDWVDRDGRERSSLVVEADAVGPDATRGLTRFARVKLDAPVPDAAAPGDVAVEAGATADDPWAAQGPTGADAADPWGDGPDRTGHAPAGAAEEHGEEPADGHRDAARAGELVDA